MGRARYLGPEVPAEELIWQDPLPGDAAADAADIAPEGKILASGLTVASWSRPPGPRPPPSAARQARRRQRCAHPPGAAEGLGGQPAGPAGQGAATLEGIQAEFNQGAKKVSLADLIVLAGSAAVEKAAKDAGVAVTCPSRRSRGCLRSRPTSPPSSRWSPADGFRNFQKQRLRAAEDMLIDKAQLLTLTAPEMTVLDRRPARAGQQCRRQHQGRVHHRSAC
jgi:catalase-peroxidase